jgi:hypothetical protein
MGGPPVFAGLVQAQGVSTAGEIRVFGLHGIVLPSADIADFIGAWAVQTQGPTAGARMKGRSWHDILSMKN